MESTLNSKSILQRLSKPFVALCLLASSGAVSSAQQAPGGLDGKDIPISSRDRVYLSDQTSNTVSVINPSTNRLLGVIRLGDDTPGNLSPLYKGQLLVHGMGLSPDHKTLDVVSIGSNSVTFIDTATNAIRHVSYVGRAPHEAMFTQDGLEVWVTVRGEDYVQVLDGKTFEPIARMTVPNGPGMTIFSPDGKYGYVVSSFVPEAVVIDVHSHKIVGHVKQASPFSPDLAATPDGKQVWFTLKDTGKTQVINAQPPFNTLAVLDTGPITNHVNIVRNSHGQFAYVTVGGLNAIKVFTTTDHPELVATIPTGELPHGLWPSGDGKRIYVGLENGDSVAAVDTETNKVIAVIPSGQSPQGMVYIPNAVPSGDGLQNLIPLGESGEAIHITLSSVRSGKQETTVTINNQGLIDLLEAAVTGLEPKTGYVLLLSERPDGSGKRQPLAGFMTNPAGAAIVTALGPLRSIVKNEKSDSKRYLLITKAGVDQPVVQTQN